MHSMWHTLWYCVPSGIMPLWSGMRAIHTVSIVHTAALHRLIAFDHRPGTVCLDTVRIDQVRSDEGREVQWVSNLLEQINSIIHHNLKTRKRKERMFTSVLSWISYAWSVFTETSKCGRSTKITIQWIQSETKIIPVAAKELAGN